MLFMTYDAQPVVRCGICEKPIFTANAIVVYPRGIEPGQLAYVVLAHHGSCMKQACAKVANAHGPGMCMELTEYGDRLRRSTASPA